MISLTNGYHKEHSGLVSSAIFFAMYVAFAVMPLFAGKLAAAFGMNAIMLLSSACTILSGIFAFLIQKRLVEFSKCKLIQHHTLLLFIINIKARGYSGGLHIPIPV